MPSTTITTALVVLAVIIGATVTVVTGDLDGATYAALLGSALGLAGGAGAHAAGVKQATDTTA
jgi:hypothetical protein